jgi:hypothetical protein
MKKLILLLTAVVAVISASCKKDEPKGAPELLAVSPVILEFSAGEDGIFQASASFQIDADADDVYLYWSDDSEEIALLSDEKLMETRGAAQGKGDGMSKIYTLPEKLPVFKTYYLKVIAANGDKFLSKTVSFETYKSGEYNQTAYIEADEAECVAEEGSFTITMYKDREKYDRKEGGYMVTVTASATGNTDGSGKYTAPDGKYNVTIDNMLFRTIIPGAGAYMLRKNARLEIEKNMLGQWDVAVYFDANYEDWNTFQKVTDVAFFIEKKPVTVKNKVYGFQMKNDVTFEPDLSTVKAAVLKRKYGNSEYTVLTYDARSARLSDGNYEFLSLALILPKTVEGNLKNLNGTYTFRGVSSTAAFGMEVDWLGRLLRIPSEGFTNWSRFSRDSMKGWEYMLEVAFPTPGSDVVTLTMSDDENWIWLKVDMTDEVSSRHVRCETPLMLEDIKIVI